MRGVSGWSSVYITYALQGQEDGTPLRFMGKCLPRACTPCPAGCACPCFEPSPAAVNDSVEPLLETNIGVCQRQRAACALLSIHISSYHVTATPLQLELFYNTATPILLNSVKTIN